MKKSLLILAAAAFAFAACNNAEEGPKYPTPEAGATYTFEGTVATDGFTWESSSAIGVYCLTEGVKALNVQAKIEEWANPAEKDSSWYQASKWEGQATAPFITTDGMDLKKGENEFLVYSPYDENMSYVPSLGMIYDLSISDEQTQPKANVAGGCFALGKTKGIAAKDIFQFELSPVTALLKINVSSSEFAAYGLKKITLIDESKTAKLGGKFDVNVNDLSFTESSSFSTVATTITSVSNLGSDTQSIFVNLLPGDYSSTEFTVIVELTSDKGNVTIPMKKNGVNCEAGKVSELNITDLKSSDNIYAWYCPVESRKLVGCDYAYGDANCYLIQCKTAVYNGTLTPNADIPESVTIDYRMRGDFTQGETPEGVTFEWAKKADGATVYAPRHDGFFNATDYTITVDEANYTVTVKNNGATGGAPMLIMKKGDKMLWGWSFWNIASDGTKLETVQVGSHNLANMNIGQASSSYTKLAEKFKTIYSTNYFYQFGRFLPIFWDSYFTNGFLAIAAGQPSTVNTVESGNPSVSYPTAGNLVAIQGPFQTLKESLAYPYGAITSAIENISNWTDEYIGDLWGCEVGKNSEAGTKSIYDPCPKGWRVPDYSALEDIAAALPSTLSESDYFSTSKGGGLKIGQLELFYTGYIAYKYTKPNKATDFRVTNYGMTTGWTSSGNAMYWSNYAASQTANSPFMFSFYGKNKISDATLAPCVGQTVRTTAASVRCQKDDDNR